jgi:hypothetical protein
MRKEVQRLFGPVVQDVKVFGLEVCDGFALLVPDDRGRADFIDGRLDVGVAALLRAAPASEPARPPAMQTIERDVHRYLLDHGYFPRLASA